MSRNWVINASPIIVLAKVDHVWLLPEMTEKLIIPQSVADEIDRIEFDDPGKRWLTSVGYKYQIPNVPISPKIASLDLGSGETDVLAFAESRHDFEAIIDDRAARNCAVRLGIPFRGTLGVLLYAKRKGHIKEVAPIIQDLLATGLYLDPKIVGTALELASEKE